MSYITKSRPVLLRPFQKCPWQEDIVGILKKHLFDANGQLLESIVYVKKQFSRDERDKIKVCILQSIKNKFKIILRTHYLTLNDHPQNPMDLIGSKETMNGYECPASMPCSIHSNANHGRLLKKLDMIQLIGLERRKRFKIY